LANGCTVLSRGNGNPWITLTMYKGKYVQESSCTSRGNRILLKVCFKPVKKKPATIVLTPNLLSGAGVGA